jgi:hypothetical protein
MPEFLLLSPLPDWTGGEQKITEEIGIRHFQAPEPGWWLCYDFTNEYAPDNVRYRRRQEAAFKLMLHALYSIQVLAPVGGTDIFFLYRKTSEGLVLESTQRRQPFLPTEWARLCRVPETFAQDIPTVLDHLHQAFQKPTLRLQIPVWLLEQGLGAPDRHIRILLWATGLDGLTRSGGVANFAERLCQLLGADTLIFPPSDQYPQPKYRVKDVVEDLYQLRTEMAHGLPFHEKFRKTRGFLGEDGQPLSKDFATYRYDHVLEECSAFLLCKALREIFLHHHGLPEFHASSGAA